MTIYFNQLDRYTTKISINSFQYVLGRGVFRLNNRDLLFGDPIRKSRFLNKLNLKYEG